MTRRTALAAAALLLTLAALACERESTPAPVEAAETGARTPPPEPTGRDDEALAREAAVAPALANLLEHHHLRRAAVDDELATRAFTRWVDGLDPGHLFLLQADVDALAARRPRFDDELRSGRLATVEQGSERLRARGEVVRGMVSALMQRPVPLSSQESYDHAAGAEPWCTSEEALRERWRRVITFQTLQRAAGLLSAEPGLDEAEAERRAREELAADFEARFDRLQHADAARDMEILLNAFAAARDPHSAFLPAARRRALDARVAGQIVGVGLELVEHQRWARVAAITPGSPAWLDGGAAIGDVVLAIGDAKDALKPVEDHPVEEIAALLRGEKGTTVFVQLRKPDGQLRVITLKRDLIRVEVALARGGLMRLKRGQPPVAFIRLPGFYGDAAATDEGAAARSSADDVRALLDAARSNKASAVVLDLRGNEGGLVSEAVRLAGLFIDQGPVLQTRSNTDATHVLSDERAGASFEGVVVVLLDHRTASAAEILAAALQDWGRAVVVGPGPSFGKGTVQALVNLDEYIQTEGVEPLKPLGTVKLTTQQFFRPAGPSLQLRGVEPDLLLPDLDPDTPTTERDLPDPVPWTTIAPAAGAPTPTPHPRLDALRAASQRRRAGDRDIEGILNQIKVLHEVERAPVRLDLEAIRERRRRLDELWTRAAPPPPRPLLLSADLRPAEAPAEAAAAEVQRRWLDEIAWDRTAAEAVAVAGDLVRP